VYKVSDMSSYTGQDDVGAVVADVGSYATRIGFAGDDVPVAHFPSVRIFPKAEVKPLSIPLTPHFYFYLLYRHLVSRLLVVTVVLKVAWLT